MGSWMGEPPKRGGHLLGDALVGLVILFFIPLVVRQFLSLAQQTGHTYGTWDLAHWKLLLPPAPDPLSVMFPSSPR